MKTLELIQLKRSTYTIPEIRKMLGLGKTESYWILQHRPFEITKLNGELRVTKSSFEAWYDNQVKYKKVDGPPPGRELRDKSYSVHEVAELVGVSDETIYVRVNRGEFETYTVDYCTRITKESFERWYEADPRYRMKEDREKDQPLLDDTYSMPDMRRMLGVHRNTIYSIVAKEGPDGTFEYVTVAGQKRITKKSFWKWYESQTRYKVLPLEQAAKDSDPIEDCDCGPAPEVAPGLPSVPELVVISEPAVSTAKAYYTVEDLAQGLGISKQSAYSMVHDFKIKSVKAGKTIIIPADAFHAVLSERRK